MTKRKICKCGKPSVPGLFRGFALCQYHYNVRQFGRAWADQVQLEEEREKKIPLEVWMLKDTQGGWSFSFDPPTKKGWRYWRAKGRRIVYLTENNSGPLDLQEVVRVAKKLAHNPEQGNDVFWSDMSALILLFAQEEA